MAQKCFICKSSEVNDLELGEFLNCNDVHVHYFCLLLTTSLEQNGEDDEGLLGFLVNDVKKCVVRLKKNNCYVCRKPFANIECSKAKCSRKFHTLCGLNRCLSIFTEKYMSFCENHHHLPMKDVHNETETCLICYDAMGQFNSITSIQPNCCKSGWMHKKCVAHYAKNSGYFCKCPLCNNDEKFRNFIAHRGVYIPDQDAAWELEPNAFAELQEGPKICQATNCCAFRRSIRNKRFRMKACTACGSYTAHIKCWFPHSRNFTGRAFICNNCTVIINHNSDEAEVKVNQTVDDTEPIVIEDEDGDTNIRRRNERGNTYLKRTRSQRIFCDSDSDSSEPVVKELRGRKIKLNTKKVFDEKSEIIKTHDKKFHSTPEYSSNNSRESLDIQNEEENQDMEKIRRQKTTTDNDSDDSNWEGGESFNNSNIKQKEVRKLRERKIKINTNEDYDMLSETSHSIDSNSNSSLDFQIQSTSRGHRRKKRTRLNMTNDYNSEDLSNESDTSDWALSTIKRYRSSIDLRDSSDCRPKSRQAKRSPGILTDISNDNGNSSNSMFGATSQKNRSDGSIRSRQTNKNPIKKSDGLCQTKIDMYFKMLPY